MTLKNTTLSLLLLLTGATLTAQNASKDKKLDITAGLLNARQKDDISNLVERAFIKPQYAIDEHFSVSAEFGTSYFALPEKRTYNISPAIHATYGKTKASLGYSDVNNALFAKASYKLNDHLSLIGHCQNLPRAPFETKILPDLTDDFNVAKIAMLEWKTKLAEKNTCKLTAVSGIGFRQANDKTSLAYKNLLVFSTNRFTLIAGIQPLHPIGFQPQGTLIGKYKI